MAKKKSINPVLKKANETSAKPKKCRALEVGHKSCPCGAEHCGRD